MVVKVVLPVSAAAAHGWGVTYGDRRIGGARGQPGGGGRALGGDSGGGHAHGGALALAEVPLALTNKCLLVALHPLQLLLCSHAPSRLAVLELQGFCRR